MTAKRRYTQRKRAQSQDETRRRIVEATMQLHEELGPRATTISAIAERAGVQRLTVYRHFPDETAVFQACTSHWLSLNPPPNPQDWNGIEDGAERFHAALRALYGYYRSTARMWEAAIRDEREVPALQGPMQGFRDYLASISDGIRTALGAEASAGSDATATVGHALRFRTWQSLAAEGIDDEAAALLATRWLRAACARHEGSAAGVRGASPGAAACGQ